MTICLSCRNHASLIQEHCYFHNIYWENMLIICGCVFNYTKGLQVFFLKEHVDVTQKVQSYILPSFFCPPSHSHQSAISSTNCPSVLSAVSSCVFVGNDELLSSPSIFSSLLFAPLLHNLHNMRRAALHRFLNVGSQAA